MIGASIQKAVTLLQMEKIVAIPTETVYGLAGNAYSPKAVSAIFEAKNRPSFDPLIVHVADSSRIAEVSREIPAALQPIIDQFMPGPLTVLLPKNEKISDLVTAGSDLVAVRIPANQLTQKLLQSIDFPLTAPSANPFGYISPTQAEHVEAQLGDKIPYILDGGACEVGVESTIVGMEAGQITIFRKGGTPIEDIEQVVGPVKVRAHSSSNPEAPGMLKSHYAPKVPFQVGEIKALMSKHVGKKIGILSFTEIYPDIPAAHQRQLSLNSNLREAAQHLFAAMRYLDGQELDIILAEWMPEEGLGRAINDRLKRASA